MFTLAKRQPFAADAVAFFPSPDEPGNFVEWPFKLYFTLLPEEEGALVSRITEEDMSEPTIAGVRIDKRLLRRIVSGWDDVVDEHGQQIPFSEAALEQALDVLPFRLAAFSAYQNALKATLEARLGN